MMLPKPRRITSKSAIEAARKDYCELCGRRGVIHVHHIKSKGSGGNDEADNLVSLCPVCHDKVHRGLISREALERMRGRQGGEHSPSL
jgi:predicted HNH restriction endonuclease